MMTESGKASKASHIKSRHQIVALFRASRYTNFVERRVLQGGAATTVTAEHRIVRPVYGAGRWFPDDPATLREAVERFIEEAQPPVVKGRVVGAIAPHAGYDYSGKVAGYVYRTLRDHATAGDTPETVVVLGVSHSAQFHHIALMDGHAVATPLGETALDVDAVALLTAAHPRIVADYRAHVREHSAENEIPFVQAALPAAQLVVGLIGDHDQAAMEGIASALENLAGKKKIVVIASSDMLHDPNYERVCKTDQSTLRKVAAMDITGVLRAWDFSQQTFCGIAPVGAVMRFAQAQGCKRGTLLYYRNSGDDDPASRGRYVVGYGAVVFAV